MYFFKKSKIDLGLLLPNPKEQAPIWLQIPECIQTRRQVSSFSCHTLAFSHSKRKQRKEAISSSHYSTLLVADWEMLAQKATAAHAVLLPSQAMHWWVRFFMYLVKAIMPYLSKTWGSSQQNKNNNGGKSKIRFFWASIMHLSMSRKLVHQYNFNHKAHCLITKLCSSAFCSFDAYVFLSLHLWQGFSVFHFSLLFKQRHAHWHQRPM